MNDPLPDEAWTRALSLLSEAESAPGTQPHMIVHASYYALYHAARAVLLKLDGMDAPVKHVAVVSRFGYHANIAGHQDLKTATRLFGEAKQQRIESDYKTNVPSPTAGEAASIAADARTFLQTCARLHGFPPP